MTVDAYINPDFGWPQKLIFLLAAIGGLLICLAFIIGGVRMSVASTMKSERRFVFYERAHNRIQRLYEMIIAGTSVMSFSCAYVIINHIDNMANAGHTTDSAALMSLISVWENGRDFVLLLLICLSCVLGSILDRLLIPLKLLKKEEKACVRMLAMFYAIFILIYLNYIGDESEYSPVMIYYLGLMVGRFVYFDASFSDFIAALKNMLKNIYLLILCMTLMGLLCYFGFCQGYLLERNYYIVGLFYTHLAMLAAVFIIYHTRLMNLIIRKPHGYTAPEDRDDETGDYGYEGEDEDDGYGYEDEDDEEYEDAGVEYEDAGYDDRMPTSEITYDVLDDYDEYDE